MAGQVTVVLMQHLKNEVSGTIVNVLCSGKAVVAARDGLAA
jgi:hypothetical protein